MGLVAAVSVLVVNAGSASLKLTMLDTGNAVLGESHVERWDGRDTVPLRDFVSGLDHPIHAVGHRVVHGGTEPAPVLVDDRVRARIEELTELAPLHQPRALAGIDATAAVLPDVPAVACFDNAFHATLPDAAATYALPAQWRQAWACAAMASTGCLTPTPPAAPRGCWTARSSNCAP